MRGRFAFAAFAGFGLVVLRGWAEAASTCPAPLGALVAIEGQVEFWEHASASWRPAPLNVPLCPGARVRVGDRSRATAALPDAPTYRIDQNTTFHLVSAPAKPERPAVIRLVEGALYIFSRRPRTLTIDTPLVDAAVEGTEFLVRADRSRTAVAVFEGTVAARNAHGEVRATAGHVAIAEPGRAPVSQLMVRPREAAEWALHYPPILTVLADPRAATAAEVPQPVRDAARRASRGDIPGALDRLEAVPAAERGALFYLHRAAILLSVGRVDQARADIDRALAEDPDAGLAYALRAVIAVAQNEGERALADGRRAVELDPRSAAAWIALSYAQQARFDLDGARDSLRTAVEAQPKDALAWARLSELWLMAGRRDRARQAAETAADLAPELARVQSVLGFAALAEFRTQTARQAFERALARDPADPQARFGLGLARIRQGDLEAGRNDIEAAVALDPNRSLLRSYLGKAYFEERTTNPLTYLKELVNNFPNQENTLAAEQFAIAKELDPKDPTPFLYDAIRKQSENRPVEALRDLEKSIELNDNRAIYRSRELLDQDRAARGTSLARIYNDLGFEQLGVNEATNSLSLDPSSAAAHRFLSDTYLGRPRHEIARVSELLQAQLLQDININPVQPSLSETNLNVFTRGGPTRAGFNEFTPLFERNQAQLNVSGEVGSNGTWADEVVVSGLYNRFSISAGQFHSETDGFRKNFALQQDLQTLFVQAAVSPELNVQAELRRRRTEEGDVRLNFDPDDFTPELHRDVDQDNGRIGLRFSPSPRSDMIASLIYNVRHRKTQDPEFSALSPEDSRVFRFPIDSRGHHTGLQAEGQYLLRYDMLNITAGLAFYDVDINNRLSTEIGDSPNIPDLNINARYAIEHNSGYVYSNIHTPRNVMWTLGFAYDDYYENQLPGQALNREEMSPKLGVVWGINNHSRLRLAAFKAVKPALIASQTIQPTQIAGFNQFFDDLAATTYWQYGIGFDTRPTRRLYWGAECSWRDLDVPFGKNTEDWDEELYRTYLYWTPVPGWAASAEARFDVFDSHSRSILLEVPNKLETISFPVTVRYFSPLGIFTGVSGTYVQQNVQRGVSSQPDGRNRFIVVDAGLGFNFPQRRGLVGLEVRNLFDSGFKFQDDRFRGLGQDVATAISPFIPERMVLARAVLNF